MYFPRTVKLLPLWTLALLPCLAGAQTWLEDPAVRICEDVTVCDDEKDIELTAEEEAYADRLLEGIPARATAADVTSFFGRSPDRVVDRVEMSLSGTKGMGSRYTWNTQAQDKSLVPPHVDVYFFNGQAFMFKWWFKTMRKMVQVSYGY
jgi:hypothetical protein